MSDGITNVVSDEEVVDLSRTSPDPQTAARNVMNFAEEVGLDDNASVVVLPLAGWGDVRGPDQTKELRNWRRKQAELSMRERQSSRG